jgi:hypothetical protein
MTAGWATLGTLVAGLAWLAPELARRWRGTGVPARAGVIVLWLAGAAFLLARPHDATFSGLDDMTYRSLAQAFRDGRGFHDPDTVLAEVPEDLRENFLLVSGSAVRPTRDRAFELVDGTAPETAPFFMPLPSLAAAGLDPILAPERFVPLVGALGWALLLAAGFVAGGGWGLVVAAALALGTAWPAWFFRGFHAEALGAALIAAVVVVAAIRPVRGGTAAAAGFALGLSVSYHPTLVALAGPVALGLMLERNERQTTVGVAAGLLAGVFPFWAMTRWVCQPYGDWTRWANLKNVVWAVPEHRAVALVVGVLAALALAGLGAGFVPAVRARIRAWDARLLPWGWAVLAAAPWLAIAFAPDAAGEALRAGARSTWSGIRWPFGLLLLAGAGAILVRRRPARERFWLVALGWAALLFLYVKGVETPVGLWSQRRFLPIVWVGLALLAAPAAAALAGWGGAKRKALVAALAVAAGGANLVRWPAAYAGVTDQGATAWTAAVAERLGTNRWVVFDYYAHSVPYAPGLKHRVLGLGESSRSQWPEVADWISALAKAEEVWVATSWSSTELEDGWRLEPTFAATGAFPIVKTKGFFPAEPGNRPVRNGFARAVPLAPGERVFQDKVLDGSPIGLRGPWGPVRNGATWTRAGSGIVGPVPPPGGRVTFRAEGTWTPPVADGPERGLHVSPPWGGASLRLGFPAGDTVAQGELVRPADDAERAATGTYEFRAERPYDPAAHGLRGYPADLGVLLRRVIIRIEPGGPIVTD